MTTENTKASEENNLRKRAVLWTVLACAALGLIVGVMTGMSVSPIVTAVVGLIFAFTGGSIIVLIKGRNSEERILVGKSIFALSLTVFIGVILGVKVREGDWLQTVSHEAIAYRYEGSTSVCEIIDLYKSGIPTSVIISILKTTSSTKSTPLLKSDLMKLKEEEVPESIIQVMLLGDIDITHQTKSQSNSKLYSEPKGDNSDGPSMTEILGNN